jgi:hypothetical protein
MNRSILIILCDFLLVTLVAFSSFEPEKAPRTETRTAIQVKAMDANQDLVGTMKLALEDEKQTREQLASSLEQKVTQLQENARRTEAQAAKIEQERLALAQKAAAAQTSLTEAQNKLIDAATENKSSKEMVEALKADLKDREKQTQAVQQQLAATERAAQAALAEKQELNTQLQVSETEKRLTRDQVAELRGTVQAEREEKIKILEHASTLATNVATLAKKSGELTQEIRDNRPLAANAIYSQFLTNRTGVQFAAKRSGLFGLFSKSVHDKFTQGLIFTEGKQAYLLLHVDDTPLTLRNPGTDWNRLLATLSRGDRATSAGQLSFLAEDPRVVVLPVTQPQVAQLGVQAYPAATDPYKFPDAVVVGANEDYYGECKFQIEPALPQYVRLDRSFVRGLFGKFNPSRGDLVLTKTGELLGIMANSEYCVALNRVTPSRTILLSNDTSDQQTGQILSQLSDRVFQMPQRLK